MKKHVLLLAALAVLCGASQSHAATAPATPQQNRMKTCAAQYHQKNIAKAEYHKFMSQCLKTHPAATTKTAPIKP